MQYIVLKIFKLFSSIITNQLKYLTLGTDKNNSICRKNLKSIVNDTKMYPKFKK